MSPTDENADDCSLQWALQKASEIKDLWHGGTSPDLIRVLETYPGLKMHRTVVIDLASVAYDLRRKAGESPDAGEFARQFRSFERAIALYLMVSSIADNDPQCAALRRNVTWPEPGSTFLGFTVIREIGRGAAGRVYLATEDALGGRRVAVKFTLEGGHEANILGRLEHVNIVPIYSTVPDKAGKLTAVCMPYNGEATLAAVLDCMYADHQTPERASAILAAIDVANAGADVSSLLKAPHRILHRGSYVDGVLHLGAAACRCNCLCPCPQYISPRPETAKHPHSAGWAATGVGFQSLRRWPQSHL